MLDDRATTSAKLSTSVPCPWASWKVFTPGQRLRAGGTVMRLRGVTTRCSRAAAAVIVLLVEPGS
jgi:hypothetical protein